MPRAATADSVNDLLLDRINRHLNAYSVAALTAGVGALALASPAAGEVIVTKANVQIPYGGQASIDLNKDGIDDFTLTGEVANYDHSFYGTFAAVPLAGGRVMAGARGPLGPYASALAKGAKIGPSARFSSSLARSQVTIERFVGEASAGTTITYYGKWSPTSGAHYLGVKFLIKGATHYGWIRFSFKPRFELAGTITEFAYETVANKKIQAGQTSDAPDAAVNSPHQELPTVSSPSLGMLALGTDGFPLWRRHEDSARAEHPVSTD